MTYIPGGGVGVKSTSNSDTSLSTAEFNQRTSTAQAGSTTTITLDASASGSDDTYNNYVIKIIGGTGLGQYSLITDYVGSTKVATANFAIAPDSTSTYIIYHHSGQCQQQNHTNKHKTIKLSALEFYYFDMSPHAEIVTPFF